MPLNKETKLNNIIVIIDRTNCFFKININNNKSFYIKNKYSLLYIVKFVTAVKGDQKAPFSIATTPGLLLFTFDAYFILPSVKQGCNMYHF